jgi:predicted nucleotidyltransferase
LLRESDASGKINDLSVEDGGKAMSRQAVLEMLRNHLPEIKEHYAVRELLLFGSVARDEAATTSDVDLVVDFEGAANFDRFMGLRFFLEDLLGQKVDLVTRKALRPAIKQAIEQEAIHVA